MYKIKCKIPSTKKIIYVSEINNKLFFNLHKYIINKDIIGFYNLLDEHIANDTPINNLNLLDKFYLYINIYANSVKPFIPIREDIDYVNNYPFDSCLDSFLDIDIKPLIYKYKFNNLNIELTLSCPKRLIENENDLISFDTISSINKIKVNDNEYLLENETDLEVLNIICPITEYSKINQLISENYNYIIKIIDEKIELPLLSPIFFKFICEELFNSGLDNIIESMYFMLRKISLSTSEFMSFSPMDSEYLLFKFIKEKKAEAEEEEKSKNKQNNEHVL